MSKFFRYQGGIVIGNEAMIVYPKHWYNGGKVSYPQFNIEQKVKNQVVPAANWPLVDVKVLFEVGKQI